MFGLFCPKQPFTCVDLPPHSDIHLALRSHPLMAIFLRPYGCAPSQQYSFSLMAPPPHNDISFGLTTASPHGNIPSALQPCPLMAIFLWPYGCNPSRQYFLWPCGRAPSRQYFLWPCGRAPSRQYRFTIHLTAIIDFFSHLHSDSRLTGMLFLLPCGGASWQFFLSCLAVAPHGDSFYPALR